MLVFASKTNHQDLGGGKVKLANELFEEIFKEFTNKRLASEAIPEHLTVLRTLQFVSEYKQDIIQIWLQSQ